MRKLLKNDQGFKKLLKQTGGDLKKIVQPELIPMTKLDSAAAYARFNPQGVNYTPPKTPQQWAKGNTYDPTNQWAMDAIYATTPIFGAQGLSKGLSKLADMIPENSVNNFNKEWVSKFANYQPREYNPILNPMVHGYTEYKKGGDVHDKPGGSNVGKYKGVHSFAGPSGGAPAGSYPINTRKRAIAALAYAHNAPNPAGIRAAVHRKYPDLGNKQTGGIITDPQGQYNHPGEVTRIPGNSITMAQVPYSVYGVPDSGQPQMMHPEGSYEFPGASSVTEFPILKKDGGCSDGNKSGDPDFPKDIPTQRKTEFLDFLKNTSMEKLHQEFFENPLGLEGEDAEAFKKGGHWIQGAIKHPGRCTPGSPNYDCPKGSPQWNLAQTFKKHHGFHKKQEGGQWFDRYYMGDTYNQALIDSHEPQEPQDPFYPNDNKFDPRALKQEYNQNNPKLNPGKFYLSGDLTAGSQFTGVNVNSPRSFDINTNVPTTYQNPSNEINAPGSFNAPYQGPGNPYSSQTPPTIDPMQNIRPAVTPPSDDYKSGKVKARKSWMDSPWANPDLWNAGMEGVTNVLNYFDRQKQEKWLRNQTAADSWNIAGAGNRGDYSTNNGYFRPDSQVPVQFPGAAGSYHYQEGGEYSLSDEDAILLRQQGYDLEEI